MRIDILTLFPEIFDSFMKGSIVRIAQEKNLVEFHLTNIRDFTSDPHRTVDDRPFGGGPGMVMKPEPVFVAFEHILKKGEKDDCVRILLTPQGRTFRQEDARRWSRTRRMILIAGRYEGFDERVRIGLGCEEISIGDYVLSGGEVAAMVVIEAVIRLIPGVLGEETSVVEESFERGLLEYPQYTRPREFRGMRVPEVLLSGDHEKIRKWRLEQARSRTLERRSDLLAQLEEEGRRDAH